MERKLSKWGALYFWEPILNKNMLQYDLEFDKLICVKMANPTSYIGYYTVKHLSNNKNIKFCQFNLIFDNKGRIKSSYLLTWRECDKGIIILGKGQKFIFDKREDFDWLDDSDSDSCFSFKQ
jgi:hypothetical protein